MTRASKGNQLNIPAEISDSEWLEIIGNREVREGWGLLGDETVADISSMIYGAKFNFVSGGPGYTGVLFILQGDALESPLRLIRQSGKLINL